MDPSLFGLVPCAGRLGRAASSSRLDRTAFERVVTETSELLQRQLATVEAHTGSVAQRSAILRAYAVQAIAAFANEEESESEDEDEGAAAQLLQWKQQQDQPGWQERPTALASAPAGPEGSSSEEDSEKDDEHPGPLPRPYSAAAFCSPRRRLHPHPPPGGTASSVAASGCEQISSSVLPDAPPESALEDTAAMSMQQQQQQQQQQQVARQVSSQHLQVQEQAGSGAHAFPDGKVEDTAGSEMRGALSRQGASSEHDATMGQLSGQTSGDGPVDMVRSPAPVDSPPEPPSLERLRLAATGSSPRQQQQGQEQQEQGQEQEQQGQEQEQQGQEQQEQEQEQREVSLPLDATAPLMATAARPSRPSGHGQFKREASGVAGADSSGRASSDAAAAEQPKRQRKAGSSGGGGSGALGLLLQRRQGLVELAPMPWGPVDDDKLEMGQGATSSFRCAQPLSQQDGCDGENIAAASAAIVAGAEPGSGSEAEGRGGAEPAQEQQEPNSSDGTRRVAGRSAALLQPQGATSGSSVWGSTLVCADLTVNDVASAYWPFLRSAMKGEVRAQVLRVRMLRALPRRC